MSNVKSRGSKVEGLAIFCTLGWFQFLEISGHGTYALCVSDRWLKLI